MQGLIAKARAARWCGAKWQTTSAELHLPEFMAFAVINDLASLWTGSPGQSEPGMPGQGEPPHAEVPRADASRRLANERADACWQLANDMEGDLCSAGGLLAVLHDIILDTERMRRAFGDEMCDGLIAMVGDTRDRTETALENVRKLFELTKRVP